MATMPVRLPAYLRMAAWWSAPQGMRPPCMPSEAVITGFWPRTISKV